MNATITVSYDAPRETIRSMEGVIAETIGVEASLTYPPGAHLAALATLDRMAEDLRRQIADAAERCAS